MTTMTDNERFAHERSYKRASILWGMIGFFMIALVIYGTAHVLLKDDTTKHQDVTRFAVRGDVEQLTAPSDWE